jgi:hypothetical protein
MKNLSNLKFLILSFSLFLINKISSQMISDSLDSSKFLDKSFYSLRYLNSSESFEDFLYSTPEPYSFKSEAEDTDVSVICFWVYGVNLFDINPLRKKTYSK